MSQYKTGQVKVLSATPNRWVLTGATTTGNIAVGNIVGFQGESLWFQIATIVNSTTFETTVNYNGAKALDTFFDYKVTKDFTPTQSFPELAAGDVDIRDVYTRALRSIDALLAGHKLVSGYTEVIQADADANVALGVRGKSLSQTADIFTVEKSDGTKLLRVLPGGGFIVSQAGPHAIGGATTPAVQFRLLGNWSPTGVAAAYGFAIDTTFNPEAGDDVFVLSVGGNTITKAGLGTHADFASARFAAPTIGAGAAALTNASTVKIESAPTGATNNYALWVAGGPVRLDGALDLSTGVSRLRWDSPGTGIMRWLEGATPTERMRLESGILLLGTTVTTGAGAGSLVLGNSTAIRAVNAAGSNTLRLIELDTGNATRLSMGSAAATAIGTVASFSNAAAGDLLLENAQAVRFANAAGNNTLLAISMNASNNIRMDFTTQTTIGANGAASALTANPVGYIIIDIAGTERIIPFYTK